MDRYCYMLVKQDREWDSTKEEYRQSHSGYHIYDRTVSHVKEIAVCQDFGFANTIVQALNNETNKSNYRDRRA